MDKIELGKRIKAARLQYAAKIGNEFSQTNLANKAGVTSSFISYVEAGKTNIAVDKLSRIAEACEVPMSYILGESLQGEEIPKELRELGVEYIAVTKELKESGLSPEDIRNMIDVISKMKKPAN